MNVRQLTLREMNVIRLVEDSFYRSQTVVSLGIQEFKKELSQLVSDGFLQLCDWDSEQPNSGRYYYRVTDLGAIAIFATQRMGYQK